MPACLAAAARRGEPGPGWRIAFCPAPDSLRPTPVRALPSAFVLVLCTAARIWAGADSTTAGPAVSARLSIPPAEINVIGDPVTLSWHFTNPYPRPLAFVWEACCRLNGRLIVSQGGRDLPPIPPGPASAHAFAKPAIILPGRENTFESMLADWVDIQQGGHFQLRGRYVGVLPEQRPPYPPSVELWRGEVSTAPIDVSLVTVADYLGQRSHRAARRGLEATLSGPADLPARGPLQLEVTLRNSAATPLVLQWPLDADLWLVDAAGRRLYRSPVRPTGSDAAVRLAPGEAWRTTFPLTAGDLNGAPFGTYQAFLDFPARDGGIRTPSLPHEFRWALSPATVASLLEEATRGSPNPRNPALRLLRQYLEPVAEVLAAVEPGTLAPAAATLREQLRLAATLRQLPVTAGRMEIALSVSPGGVWEPTDPRVARASSGASAGRLAPVLAARRHLGVEAAVQLEPSSATTLAEVRRAAAELSPHAAELAVAPRYVGEAPAGTVPGTVSFPMVPAPANLVLHLGPGPSAGLARATGTPPLVPASDWPALPRSKLAAPSELDLALGDVRAGTPQVAILADPRLRWAEVRPWLAPFLRRGWQVELTTLADPVP